MYNSIIYKVAIYRQLWRVNIVLFYFFFKFAHLIGNRNNNLIIDLITHLKNREREKKRIKESTKTH